MTLISKKILITGHNGFIGKNLIQKLDKSNEEIMTLTDDDGHKIDIRDWDNIKKLEEPEIIFHLAATSNIPFSFQNPRETYEINVFGTLNILELARISDADKVVFTSSYVYGIPKYLPIDEEHPLTPNNPYSRSKLHAESLLRSYYEDYGINCIIFRPFNIYGIGQKDNFLIPTICSQLTNGVIELEDPAPKRDFIHISDVISALMIAGDNNCNFEIFNLGYGKSYSVEEIVEKIIKIYKYPIEVHFRDKRRRNEVFNTIANIDKIKKKLNWKPLIDINEGLYQIVNNL